MSRNFSHFINSKCSLLYLQEAATCSSCQSRDFTTQCVSRSVSVISLNKGYKITQNSHCKLLTNVELETCFHQITNMLFQRSAAFFFALKRGEGRSYHVTLCLTCLNALWLFLASYLAVITLFSARSEGIKVTAVQACPYICDTMDGFWINLVLVIWRYS